MMFVALIDREVLSLTWLQYNELIYGKLSERELNCHNN